MESLTVRMFMQWSMVDTANIFCLTVQFCVLYKLYTVIPDTSSHDGVQLFRPVCVRWSSLTGFLEGPVCTSWHWFLYWSQASSELDSAVFWFSRIHAISTTWKTSCILHSDFSVKFSIQKMHWIQHNLEDIIQLFWTTWSFFELWNNNFGTQLPCPHLSCIYYYILP